MLYNAVHTSVNGETDLAIKIIEMFKELNTVEPLVLIEMSNTTEHRYELVKGVETRGTVIRPDIFFNGLSRMEFQDPQIVVVNGRFDMSLEHFTSYAEYCLRENKNTIFLCTGINESTLGGIYTINSTSPGYFVRVPLFQIANSALDEEFNDLCVSIGAKPIDSSSFKRITSIEAIKNLITASAGTCSMALVTEFCARYNNPSVNEESTKLRISEINTKIAELKEDSTSHNERLLDLENRKAFLSRHYAKFYVGGYSPQRKAINYELANDGIPQAISCMKHGIVPGCNVTIPYIINNTVKDCIMTVLSNEIYNAIRESYEELMYQLVENKLGRDAASDFLATFDHTNKSFNIRNDDTIDVINSADTDRAILQNATDMASLLATSRAFISRNTEFDVVNKGYND